MILALDFDGVLHPIKQRDEPLFCRLFLLEHWLRTNEHVDVVISSSWRVRHPFDEMVSYFSEDIQHRIWGMTPVLDHRLEAVRQMEIEKWMAALGEPDRTWVALDDDPSLFVPGCAEVVFCDPNRGLDGSKLRELSAIAREK